MLARSVRSPIATSAAPALRTASACLALRINARTRAPRWASAGTTRPAFWPAAPTARIVSDMHLLVALAMPRSFERGVQGDCAAALIERTAHHADVSSTKRTPD